MSSPTPSKPSIVLLEGIHPSAVEFFERRGYSQITQIKTALQGEELLKAIRSAHLVGIRSRTLLSAEILNQCPNLTAIGCFCIGSDQVDLKAATHQGIPVFNAPHSNTRSVAELVIGLIIVLFRGIFPKSLAAHKGVWLKSMQGSYEVRGKTLGIIGYGRIGSQVSIMAESLGMQIIYYDIKAQLPLGNAKAAQSLEDLLAHSDLVTIHIPQNQETPFLLDKEKLGLMKPGSYLINTGRGKLIDIEALQKLIKSGYLGGAAIDVFPKEPKSNDEKFESPLQGLDKVILTPHIGGSTIEAQYNIGLEVSQKLSNLFDFGSTEGSINFPELSLVPHENTHRILHTHKNVPGVLQQINKSIADERINVAGQYLLTNAEIGYVVLDIEKNVSEALMSRLKKIEGTICTRILY